MDENNDNKKTETPEFDDILVMRKKKSEIPPPEPPEDDTILDGFSEEETSRYDAEAVKMQMRKPPRPKSKRLFLTAGITVAATAAVISLVIICLAPDTDESVKAPIRIKKRVPKPKPKPTPDNSSQDGLVKTYKVVKGKLDDIKKLSAERGMKELAEIDETPAERAKAAAAEKNKDSAEEETEGDEKINEEEAAKKAALEAERAKNPYSAYDLLPYYKFAEEMLRLVSVGKRADAVDCIAGSFKARPDDLEFLDQVRILIQMAQPEDIARMYNDVKAKEPDIPTVSFILGNIYAANLSWAEASKAYSEAFVLSPEMPGLAEINIFARARAGDEQPAYDAYQKYLADAKTPENKKVLQLLKLSLLFLKPGHADALLARASEFPDDAESFKYYRLSRNAIYGKLSSSDFSSWDPYRFHDLHVVALLAEGKEKNVLMIRVPPSEFPDFWKVFLLWKNDSEDWKEHAAQLHEKNSGKGGDPLKKIASELWLGAKSPEALLKEVFLVGPDQFPLFCFFLSEYYRKNSNPGLCYEYVRKASMGRGNIYRTMVGYYSQAK